MADPRRAIHLNPSRAAGAHRRPPLARGSRARPARAALVWCVGLVEAFGSWLVLLTRLASPSGCRGLQLVLPARANSTHRSRATRGAPRRTHNVSCLQAWVTLADLATSRVGVWPTATYLPILESAVQPGSTESALAHSRSSETTVAVEARRALQTMSARCQISSLPSAPHYQLRITDVLATSRLRPGAHREVEAGKARRAQVRERASGGRRAGVALAVERFRDLS